MCVQPKKLMASTCETGTGNMGSEKEMRLLEFVYESISVLHLFFNNKIVNKNIHGGQKP